MTCGVIGPAKRRMICAVALATALVVAALAVPPGALATGAELAGGWHLDELDEGVTPDNSGNDNDGAVEGGAALVGGGRFGNALDPADPADSQVDVGGDPVLEPQQLTVMAWVRRSGNPGSYKYVLAKGAEACAASSYAIYTGPSGGLIFYVFDGTKAHLSPDAGTALWDNRWHAVAGTFNGAMVRLFVDGRQVGSGTPAQASVAYGLEAEELQIGTYPNHEFCGAATTWPGLIDEVRVYNGALTTNQIAFLQRPDHQSPPALPTGAIQNGTSGDDNQEGTPQNDVQVGGAGSDTQTGGGGNDSQFGDIIRRLICPILSQLRNALPPFTHPILDALMRAFGCPPAAQSASRAASFKAAPDARAAISAGDDRLFGGRGHDVQFGGGGDDLLVGGPGIDLSFGEGGNDRIKARDRTRDYVSCGPGRDRVLADRRDIVRRNCEKIARR